MYYCYAEESFSSRILGILTFNININNYHFIMFHFYVYQQN